MNLFSNSIDALAEGSQGDRWIKVSVKKSKGDLELETKDKGPGIPEKIRKQTCPPSLRLKM